MFTGIIEELGTVRAIARGAHSAVLTIAAETVGSDLKIGDSVAVNGVCLTATSVLPGGFTADVMPQTLDQSSLGELGPGSRVNLERAMAANGRFGGHIVTGHIDGTGCIRQMLRQDNSIRCTVAAAPALLAQTVTRGSIAIDGISLTVAEVTDQDFTVCLIPHTTAVTTLSLAKPGKIVNLETDILGKYVQKLLHSTPPTPNEPDLTLEFLLQNGF